MITADPLMVQDSTTSPRRGDRGLDELQATLMQAARTSAIEAMSVALAHELNQPLTAIANYIETVRDLIGSPDSDPAELRRALEDAASQSLRAGQIVRRLRGFVAKAEIVRSICSLDQLVRETLALARIGVSGPTVDVEIRIDPAADLVIVDRVQTQQVLFNLICNAIEALEGTPDGRIEITATPLSNVRVEMIVADSGKGLSADAEAGLFDPFRTEKPNGLGLGLAICRTIIEAQGGQIWTEPSRLGGGAFHFTLARAHDMLPPE